MTQMELVPGFELLVNHAEARNNQFRVCFVC